MTVTEQLREYEIRVWAEVLRRSRSLTYDGVYGDFVPDADRQLAQLALEQDTRALESFARK